jgi:hypothetical protein
MPLQPDEHTARILALVFPTLAVETVTLVQEVRHFCGRLFRTNCGFLGTQRREGPVGQVNALRYYHRELVLLSR